MKRSKGMTLMELLIAMGLSAIIMSSAFVIVRFSASTYDVTVQAIHENNNTSDAADIINRYIRASTNCAVSDSGKDLYIALNDENEAHTVLLAFDADGKKLFLDFCDGSPKTLLSENISDIEWVLAANGVKYTAYRDETGIGNAKLFSGYANKRGR